MPRSPCTCVGPATVTAAPDKTAYCPVVPITMGKGVVWLLFAGGGSTAAARATSTHLAYRPVTSNSCPSVHAHVVTACDGD
jgi:hypothetical protein